MATVSAQKITLGNYNFKQLTDAVNKLVTDVTNINNDVTTTVSSTLKFKGTTTRANLTTTVPNPQQNDFVIITDEDNMIAVYDGAKWDNLSNVDINLNNFTLDQLGDVDTTGIQNGQTIIWNGTSFVAGKVTDLDQVVAGVTATTTLEYAELSGLSIEQSDTPALGAYMITMKEELADVKLVDANGVEIPVVKKYGTSLESVGTVYADIDSIGTAKVLGLKATTTITKNP